MSWSSKKKNNQSLNYGRALSKKCHLELAVELGSLIFLRWIFHAAGWKSQFCLGFLLPGWNHSWVLSLWGEEMLNSSKAEKNKLSTGLVTQNFSHSAAPTSWQVAPCEWMDSGCQNILEYSTKPLESLRCEHWQWFNSTRSQNQSKEKNSAPWSWGRNLQNAQDLHSIHWFLLWGKERLTEIFYSSAGGKIPFLWERDAARISCWI